MLKKKKKGLLKSLFGRWLDNGRITGCESTTVATEAWLKMVMTNELFPPCDGFHFLWIYSCLRRCGPHAYTVAGGLRNCRYTRFHSRVRSHSLFCEYLTNSRVAIYAKTGLCKRFLQSGSNNSRDQVRRKPFTV